MLLTIGVLTLSLITFLLASFVLARSVKSRLNVSFAFFSYVTSFWMLANYLGANYKSLTFSSVFVRLDFLLGPFLAFAFWNLTRELYIQASPKKAKNRKVLRVVFGSLATICSLGIFFPQVVSIQRVLNKPLTIKYGVSYAYYAVILLIIILAGVINLIIASRKARNHLKVQIDTLLFGLVIAAILIALANLIVPQLTTSTTINLVIGNLSYLGIVAFVITAFYTIIKHKLFDVRLIVARTVAYVLLLGALTFLYTTIFFGISSLIFRNYDRQFSHQLFINAPLVAFLALTFQPLKKFFDKLTNRLFYRDAYDSQKLLDVLNKELVSNIELNNLLVKSAELIGTTLKSDWCLFAIKVIIHEPYRLFKYGQKSIKNDAILRLKELIQDEAHKIIVADEIEEHNSHLKEFFQQQNISIAMVLSDTSRADSKGIGYIFFGPKKSGNPYNKQDLEVL